MGSKAATTIHINMPRLQPADLLYKRVMNSDLKQVTNWSFNFIYLMRTGTLRQ